MDVKPKFPLVYSQLDNAGFRESEMFCINGVMNLHLLNVFHCDREWTTSNNNVFCWPASHSLCINPHFSLLSLEFSKYWYTFMNIFQFISWKHKISISSRQRNTLLYVERVHHKRICRFCQCVESIIIVSIRETTKLSFASWQNYFISVFYDIIIRFNAFYLSW